MAIFRKDHLQEEKTEPALFYDELKKALDGSIPSAGQAESFHNTIEDFQRDFTDIDMLRLTRAIGHFKVVATT